MYYLIACLTGKYVNRKTYFIEGHVLHNGMYYKIACLTEKYVNRKTYFIGKCLNGGHVLLKDIKFSL